MRAAIAAALEQARINLAAADVDRVTEAATRPEPEADPAEDTAS
jgi:hypothetical protein